MTASCDADMAHFAGFSAPFKLGGRTLRGPSVDAPAQELHGGPWGQLHGARGPHRVQWLEESVNPEGEISWDRGSVPS